MGIIIGALVAGFIGSLGPCSPLRLAAVISVATGGVAIRNAAAYFVGSVAATVAIVLVVQEVTSVLGLSPYLYAIAAVAFIVVGVRLLLDVGHDHAHEEERGAPTSAGASFFLGASQSLLVQPCCAPGLIWLIGQVAFAPVWIVGAGCLMYAVGQGSVVLLAPIAARVRVPIRVQGAFTWALGTFSLIVGVFYAIQA